MPVVIGPITLGLLYKFFVLPVVYDPISGLDQACDTDPLWSNWAALFQVNIRSGNVSFTAAKIIDMVWDTIVGRGGQLLLAWISYRVYAAVMMHLAEREAVDFSLFLTTMLYGHSVWTFWHATKSIFSNLSRRAIWMSLWMMASMIYVLVFPTLLSASTSYVAASRPAALLVDNSTVPLKLYLDSMSYSLVDHGIPNQPSPWYINIANLTGLPAILRPRNMMWRSNHPYTVGGDELVVSGHSYNLSSTVNATCGFH